MENAMNTWFDEKKTTLNMRAAQEFFERSVVYFGLVAEVHFFRALAEIHPQHATSLLVSLAESEVTRSALVRSYLFLCEQVPMSVVLRREIAHLCIVALSEHKSLSTVSLPKYEKTHDEDQKSAWRAVIR